MKLEFTSIEEAKAVLHALKRTSARNSHGDLNNILEHCENFEKKLFKLISDPQEVNGNLEIEPKYFDDLLSITGRFTEMMSDDEEDEEENSDELTLCEVIQERIEFLKAK